MDILTLDNIQYVYKNKYKTVHALNGVSYAFAQGKFYAVMGRSGSGKTTLLSVIAGLDNPTGGSVCFNGTDIKTLDRDKYRLDNVSVIYQQLNLFPLLSVMENVTLPLKYKSVPKDEAVKTAQVKLESVGIDSDKYTRLPAMLSGGEQQRVAIARALSSKTPIILADEPTGNLDMENSLNIVQLLRNLASAEDVCIIVVTHDPAVAERADVVLRISDGQFMDEQSA